jgi:hypothetical protein
MAPPQFCASLFCFGILLVRLGQARGLAAAVRKGGAAEPAIALTVFLRVLGVATGLVISTLRDD